MRTPQELEQESIRVARATAEPVLGHPVRAKAEATEQEFHAMLLRHVRSTRLSLWKPLAPLDVWVDEEGRVAGYVDIEAHRGAAPNADTPQSRTIAVGLVADEELLPPHARVLGVQACPANGGGELLAVLVGAPEGDPRQWIVEVNPARGQVAAVRPVALGADDEERT